MGQHLIGVYFHYRIDNLTSAASEVLYIKIKIILPYLGLGVAILIIAALISFIKGNWSLLIKTCNLVAVLSLFATIAFSGILGRGDRLRAKYAEEDDEDQSIRKELPVKSFFIGLPSIIAVIFIIINNWQ